MTTLFYRQTLGAKRTGTDEPALILLDSILPTECPCVLQLALTHSREVWILRLDKQSESFANDTSLLTKCGAKLTASIPQDSLLHHTQDCWCSARWDALSSAHGAQLWSLSADGRGRPSLTQRIENVSRTLGAWKEPQFDFYFKKPRQQEYNRISKSAAGCSAIHVERTCRGNRWQCEQRAAENGSRICSGYQGLSGPRTLH